MVYIIAKSLFREQNSWTAEIAKFFINDILWYHIETALVFMLEQQKLSQSIKYVNVQICCFIVHYYVYAELSKRHI